MKMKKSFIPFFIFLCLAVAVQVGGCKKKCTKCNSANYLQVCPVLFKQCPGFTMTVQSCRGECCVTNAADISCNMEAYSWNGAFSLDGDIVKLDAIDGPWTLHITINARENGWIDDRTPGQDRECLVNEKLKALFGQ